MARIAGRLSVVVNSTTIPLEGDWKVTPGYDEREMLTGPDGVHGHKATPRPWMIEGNARWIPGFPIDEILNAEDATVVANLANGQNVRLGEATFTGTGEVSTQEMTIACAFAGKTGSFF